MALYAIRELEDRIAPKAIPRPGRAAAAALAAVNSLVVRISAVALVAASSVLTYGAVARYFLHIPNEWQDEVSVFLIVGAMFMSGAAVQAGRGHVGIEAIVTLLSPRANRIRQFVVDAASLIFCTFFAWKSWSLLDEAIAGGFRSGSTWGPPLWVPYSLMTGGMTLLSLQLLLQVIQQFRSWRPRA